MDKLSIIVPCYNEEECLPLFFASVEKVISTLPIECEYIFVDDGSKDKSLEFIRKLAQTDERVKYISFSRNFGKEAAILAGLRRAEGNFVTLMDCDLQDPPELLAEMYSGLTKEGYDCVACRRTSRKHEPRMRSSFAHMFYKLINRFTEVEIVDGARDFRMMTRKVVDAVLSLPESDRFSKELFSWVGFKTKWLEYKNVKRARGNTKWSFKKLTSYAVNGIESATYAPLYLNIFGSILFFIAAICMAVTDIVLTVLGEEVSWLLIFLPVLFFTVSLLFGGMFILGEYLRKIFTQVKGRPQYIVAETEPPRAVKPDSQAEPKTPEKEDDTQPLHLYSGVRHNINTPAAHLRGRGIFKGVADCRPL